MVRDSVKGYLALATGLTEVTRQRAVAAARSLAASGEATAEQVQGLAEDLLATSRGNRDALTNLVKLEIDRAIGRLGLASAEEVADLTARLQRVEARLREQARPGSSAPAKATPPRAPATRTPAKKTPATATPVKKTPVKKAAATTSRNRPTTAGPTNGQAPQ
jgi:polyhydroxyalkanoate synthesis regulator phasin